MIWLTSDLHFNHKNILDYEKESRPFSSITEMNEVLIHNWNMKVSPDDTVYVLGDFFMGQHHDIIPILSRLNGKIILIRGNHDSRPRLDIYKSQGIEIKDIDYIYYRGRFFILCHFPINSEEFKDMVRRDNSEVIFCYGHVHHNAPKGYIDGTYHIGVDTNDLKPVALEQIWRESWPDDFMTPEVAKYKEIFGDGSITTEQEKKISFLCDRCSNQSKCCAPDKKTGECPAGYKYDLRGL